MAANLNISEDQIEPTIQTLKKLMHSAKESRLFERYQTIYLLLAGKTYVEVADTIARCEATVHNYAALFREGGIDALQMDYSSGRPSKLTEEQEKELVETVKNKNPEEVGFEGVANWTSPLIRTWVKEKFGVDYSDRGMREVLYRLKMSFTMPTYRLAKADVDAQIDFLEEFAGVKKNFSTTK